MKIAYCILAHNNPEYLERLTYALKTEDTHCFVHIDAKSKMLFDVANKPNVTLVKNRVPVYWGSFHIVQATLNTFQEAFGYDNYDYFVLLSGADYPVRSNEYIEKFFEKNFSTNFMSIVKMPGNGKTMDRVTFPWLPASTRTPGIKAFVKKCINTIVRKLKIHHKLPHEYKDYIFYGGSAWAAFTRETVGHILNFTKANPKFQKFFKHVLLPDESYFQTLLMNTSPTKPYQNAIMYTVWQEGNPSPETITLQHLASLEQEEVQTSYGTMAPLFARKFNPKNNEVLEGIEVIRKKVISK